MKNSKGREWTSSFYRCTSCLWEVNALAQLQKVGHEPKCAWFQSFWIMQHCLPGMSVVRDKSSSKQQKAEPLRSAHELWTMKFIRRETGWVSRLGPGYMKPVLLNPPWLLDSPGELVFLNNYPNILQQRWDWEPRDRLLKTSERSKALQRKASRKHHQSLHCRGKGWLRHCVAFIPRLRRWKKQVTRPQCSLLGPQAQITQPNEDALIPLSLCFYTPRTSKFWNHPSLGLHSYPLLFSCSVVSNSLQPQGTAARQASLSFTIPLYPRQFFFWVRCSCH